MSVIVQRALPDVRDGLKPVHRRIMYAMDTLHLASGGKTKKCATIVGEVLGHYHPHGDASVYDALVRLGQDFAQRYTTVTPQGNFGTIAGDPPAAYRYTEAKMSKVTEEMVEDINKNTVDMVRNFDDTTDEPAVLPAKFPFLLCNGTTGIAVGMATNMPTHNIREVASAVSAYIDNNDITIEELMKHIKGPDFPYWKQREYFEKVLPVPPFYKDGNTEGAITWFKDTNQGKDIWNQLTFYRDMCSKYGIKLYKSETDEIPGKIIYEDDFQIAVTDEKENLKIDVSEV